MIELIDTNGYRNYFLHEDVVKVFRENSGCVKISLVNKLYVRMEEGYPIESIIKELNNLTPVKSNGRTEWINEKFIVLINAVRGGTRINLLDGQYTFTFEDIDSVRERFDQDS